MVVQKRSSFVDLYSCLFGFFIPIVHLLMNCLSLWNICICSQLSLVHSHPVGLVITISIVAAKTTKEPTLQSVYHILFVLLIFKSSSNSLNQETLLTLNIVCTAIDINPRMGVVFYHFHASTAFLILKMYYFVLTLAIHADQQA